MPLRYDVSRVKDHERKTKDPHLGLVLNILVEHALFCRLSSITKKNVEELWYRLRVLDLICSESILSGIAFEDVQEWVGLRFNVITLSDIGFDKLVRRRLQRMFKRTEGFRC